MELVKPTTAKVLAYYDHPVWGKYAAVTRNNYGKGEVTYIACMTTAVQTQKILKDIVKDAGLWGVDQQLQFPIITKKGTNSDGKMLHYYFNYSNKPVTFEYPYANATELLQGGTVVSNQTVILPTWGVMIMEE